MIFSRFGLQFSVLAAFLITGIAAQAYESSTSKMAAHENQKAESHSKWRGDLSAEFARGLDEYDDTWTSLFMGTVSYDLSSDRYLSAMAGYSTILYRPEGQLFDNYDSRPEQYGLTDTTLSYGLSNVWSNSKARASLVNSVILPSSRVSRDASLIAGLSSGASLSYFFNRWFTIRPIAGIQYYQYEYDDADVYGFRVNAPLRLSYGLKTIVKMVSWLNLEGSYTQMQRYDYESRWTLVQSASLLLTSQIGKRGSLYAGYTWQDRVFTNEPVLSDNRTQIRAGGGIEF